MGRPSAVERAEGPRPRPLLSRRPWSSLLPRARCAGWVSRLCLPATPGGRAPVFPVCRRGTGSTEGEVTGGPVTKPGSFPPESWLRELWLHGCISSACCPGFPRLEPITLCEMEMAILASPGSSGTRSSLREGIGWVRALRRRGSLWFLGSSSVLGGHPAAPMSSALAEFLLCSPVLGCDALSPFWRKRARSLI